MSPEASQPRQTSNPLEAAVLPSSQLATTSLRLPEEGLPKVDAIPSAVSQEKGAIVALGPNGEKVFYTLNPKVQAAVGDLLSASRAKHAAAVVMDATTGEILGLGSKSDSFRELLTVDGLPMASLFKIVTLTAAVERGVDPSAEIQHSGNPMAKPSNRRRAFLKPTDVGSLSTSIEGAFGTSNNEVFAKLALNHLRDSNNKLDWGKLLSTAETLGFNHQLPFELTQDIPQASCTLPVIQSKRTFAQLATGFRNSYSSPLQIARLLGVLANDGISNVMAKELFDVARSQ
jgi:cell division protein FtsI/penicillin-binding protein 2